MKLLFKTLVLTFIVSVLNAQDIDYVTVSKGEYIVGKKGSPKNPLKKVNLDSFNISTTEITNTQFLDFIKATGYTTTAEVLKNANVFYVGLDEYKWVRDTTANWKYPNGILAGGIEDKMDHPVTCISFIDVLEYCSWAKVRLPTLNEWEVACRAGSNSNYFWGDSVERINEFGNIWKNKLHSELNTVDEFLFTSPVKTYKPNKLGMYDMYGNVFEFCSDRYKKLKRKKEYACARGGSWWCSIFTCGYFNSYDIGEVLKTASFSNHGFRVVKLK